jgi:hypothetical protein
MSRLSEAINGWRNAVSPSGQQRRRQVQWEFSSAAITVPIEQAKHRNLRLICALTRKFAQESMIHRAGAASPGSPPSAHSGLLQQGIFYRVTKDRGYVGPSDFGTRVGYSVPEILEQGGTVTRLIWTYRRRRRIAITKQVTQHFHAFPYMAPALERACRPFKDLWKDCL